MLEDQRADLPVVAEGRQAVLLGVLAGRPEELPLHFEGGGRGAVGQAEGPGQGEVGRDLVQGADGIGEGEAAGGAGVVLDHGQHDGGGAHLEEGGDLGEVGVADDDVQAPEPARVGVGLVPGVDDRALEGRLQADDLLEELGPLGDLEVDGVRIEGGRLHAHLARPGEDGARDEVGHDALDHPGEGHGPVHHVVLVAAVGVALAVGVVLVDDGRRLVRDAQRRRPHGPPQHLLAGLVVHQALEGGQALGGGVLGVGVVDVEAGAVGEHGVGQVGLDHGGQGALPGEAAGVVAGGLVLEVPADLLLDVRGVGVDQHRRGGDRVLLRAGRMDPVLGLNPAHLGGGHVPDPTGL